MSLDATNAEHETAALRECHEVTRSITKKADKHKGWARGYTVFLTSVTAAIPVTIGLSGDSYFWGRAVPSVLAAMAAVAASLADFNKHHERWNLYRRYQRTLEAEATNFRFAVAPYDGPEPDRALAQRVAQLQLDLHDEWSGLVPVSRDVAGMGRSRQ